jgi:hypothetical protein
VEWPAGDDHRSHIIAALFRGAIIQILSAGHR